MRLKALTVSGVTALALALSAGSASAATEFGDTCSGDEISAIEYTLTTLSAPPAALPLTAPTGGVVTKVKVSNQIPVPFAIPTLVKVLHSAGGNNYTVVGQQTVAAGIGTTTADARIPIQAGDRLALHGVPFSYEGTSIPSLALYCTEVEGILGAALSEVSPGSTAEFLEATVARVPLAAVIEPDADGDGYGDETQDKCPQSAAFQTECPVVVLDAYAIPDKNKVVVVVSTSTAAPVTVSGSVKLPKTAKASASAAAKLKKVTQTVSPGKLGRFVLKFPGKLKAALKELPKGKKLKLKITASAANVAGQVSTDTTKLNLKG